MPNPLLPFDTTKPGDTDFRNVYPALDRTDKTSLAKVLGTLAPFGSVTTAWRSVQIGNGSYLTQNASWNGSAWVQDDSTQISSALIFDGPTGAILTGWQPAAVGSFASWIITARIATIPNAVNYLNTNASAAGSWPSFAAQGTDPNIGINFVTKGTGALALNGAPFLQATTAVPGLLRLGPITLQWGSFTTASLTSGAASTQTITFPAAFSSQPYYGIAILSWTATATADTVYLQSLSATQVQFVVFASVLTGARVLWWLAIGPT